MVSRFNTSRHRSVYSLRYIFLKLCPLKRPAGHRSAGCFTQGNHRFWTHCGVQVRERANARERTGPIASSRTFELIRRTCARRWYLKVCAKHVDVPFHEFDASVSRSLTSRRLFFVVKIGAWSAGSIPAGIVLSIRFGICS